MLYIVKPLMVIIIILVITQPYESGKNQKKEYKIEEQKPEI